jgi:hypothetical protein
MGLTSSISVFIDPECRLRDRQFPSCNLSLVRGFGDGAGCESTDERQDALSVEAAESDEGREEDELVA